MKKENIYNKISWITLITSLVCMSVTFYLYFLTDRTSIIAMLVMFILSAIFTEIGSHCERKYRKLRRIRMDKEWMEDKRSLNEYKHQKEIVEFFKTKGKISTTIQSNLGKK